MDNGGLPILQEDDLAEVYEELHGTEAKWKSIGIHLKLPISCLEEIGKEHKGNTEECSLQMQVAWLRSKTATWRSLVEALRKSSVGHEDKARDIEKNRLSRDSTGRRNDGLSQSQPPADVFLIEHLEWLLKIGCSVDKIHEWAREKKQNQAPSLSVNGHSGIGFDIPTSSTCTPHGERTNPIHETFNPQEPPGPCSSASSEQSSARIKQRKRQPSDKSQKSKAKRSRKKETSPIRFVLINTLQGTDRERQLNLKNNMLQIIKKLKRDPNGAEFINFVDEGQAKDYYKIIKYPMCLQEIEDRIKRHQCDTCEVFCAEFDSIVENCEKYNGSDSPFTEKVQRLKVKFYELVHSYLIPDTGASASYKLSPLAAVVGESLSSENPSSDEEFNPIATTESQSTFEYGSQHDKGDGNLLEPSQTEEEEDLPHHEWKEKSDKDTIPHGPDMAKDEEMPAFEGAVKVQDVHHHDRLEETAGGTSQMSTDEDSDSELPHFEW